MGRRKIKRLLMKTVSLGLIAALSLSATGGGVVLADEAIPGASETEDAVEGSYSYNAEEYVSERITRNYTKVSAGYSFPAYSGEAVIVSSGDSISELGDAHVFLQGDSAGFEDAQLKEVVQNYAGGGKLVDLTIGNVVVMEITVPQDGQYFMSFDYLSYDQAILPLNLGMKVDGDYPFYECRTLEFETTWMPNPEPAYDRYNNQVVTVPNKVFQWERKYLMDSSYRHSQPLALELTAGTHEIELEVKEGTFLLGNIILEAPYEVSAYAGSQSAAGENIIEIQGEEYSHTNSSSVHGIAEYDTSLDPYETTDTVLNTLDSDSFATAGQKVSYNFTIYEPGYYYIAMNYRQSDKTDFPVFLDIEVDGEIPNTAFQSYGMAYTNKYKTTTLSDDDGNYLSVYLDKGDHTISYMISMDEICYIMEALDEIMSDVNDLALEITKVAGNNADKYRDLRLSRYIPDLEDKLYGYADRLCDLEQSALKWSSGKKNVAVMSSMLIAAQQLRSLANNPDEIPYRVAELSTSMNSVNHHLATTIDNLIANNIAIDRIWIYQEDSKLPKKPGFFKSCWMNLQRFIASFTEQAYSASNTNPEHLQVWVNRSSQYVQIMQKMIDESFTPQTGIEVDISIMPDQYKLVLSNSSGNAPDVATGINYTIPYELGIRGALVDMTQFEDFRKVAEPYESGFFMTGSIEGGIYSMPETMNFWVLFYRTDVLDKLGLEVPQTMEDVIDMLPELQMRGLNFYYPTAGMLLMRNFHGTAPLLMQNGGSLYSANASAGTALGSEASVDGFTQLTDLFTIYNMPVNIDNFYQHFRNGDLPIGIADYAAYNLLTNAAPELSGSWEIALAPGTMQEDGTIDRSLCGCAESCVIFKSDVEREAKAWEFIKWWSSTEVQAEFGQTLQITYGDEYIWATANMDAFAQLPIETSARIVIMETAKNVVDIARVPGTYLLEREMSNAFNDIVVNGDNEQTRIDKAVKSINREFNRKLEEFGYNDDEGNVIKEYEIPTIDTVRELLGRTDEE